MNRKILTLLLPLLLAGVLVAHAAVMPRAECFQNLGLKNRHVVKLQVRGKKVSGIYRIEPEDDSDKSIAREFTGTRTRTQTGWLLKIRFAQGAPYELAPKTHKIVWRLGKRSGREVLIVPTSGKNYDTGKYAAYEMELTACGK